MKISTLVGWSVGAVTIAFGVAVLIMSSPADTARAASPFMTECAGCHLAKVPLEGITRPELLKGHDKLGSGNDACMVCHDRDNKHLGMLGFVDGTLLPLKDSSRLCGQCHEKRYKAWQEGTHGVPAWKDGKPGFPGAVEKTCVECHDPHQPQIALLTLTKLHPAAAPPPPSLSGMQFEVLGGALLLVVGVGIIVAVTRKVG